jgi:hypothetical protein
VSGYSNKEFDAIADEDYHPDYLEYAHNKIKESVKYLTIPALFQVKHKDGRYIWLEGVLNRLDDPSIALLQILEILRIK